MSNTKIVFEWKEGEPADLAFMRAFSELLKHMTWQEAHAVANWVYSKAHDPMTKFRSSHMTMTRGGDIDNGRDEWFFHHGRSQVMHDDIGGRNA